VGLRQRDGFNLMKVPDHIIEDIKDRVNIREVVEDYVRLQKDGANYKGLCPFHQEKTPSFKVHEGKGIFKCFGCGESGNVISFLMKLESMSFREALERLAGRAGIDLPKEEEKPEQRERREQSERVFDANMVAARFFNKVLKEAPEAMAAREYLSKRGISEEETGAYMLGYSPDDWHRTEEELKKAGVSAGDMEVAGLVRKKDTGGHYDFFRGRLMFPIFDVQGRVRGFGARQLKDEKDQPKYINTPESPVFRKGSSFFGINIAKDAIRKEGKVVVVEGYTDQMALSRAGINYGVATLGTALTKEHGLVLRRYNPEVFVVFDADEAGQKATLRALETLLEAELSPRVVLIPEGKDPDDFLSEKGPDNFLKLLDAAPPLLSHYFDLVIGKAGDNPSSLSKAVSEASEMLGRVSDPIERGIFTERLSRKSGVPMSRIEVRLRRPERRNEADRSGRAGDDLAFSAAELDLLRLIIHHPETIEKIGEARVVEKVRNEYLRAFVEMILARTGKGLSADPGSFLEEIEDGTTRDRVSSLLFENDPFGDKAERVVMDVVKNLFHGDIEAKLASIRREIDDAHKKGDEGRWRNLLEKQQKLLLEKRQIGTGQAGQNMS